MLNVHEYNLIGIGEFSHGIQESWQYRLNLLKQTMKQTNKNITVFIELSIWQANNIMNYTEIVPKVKPIKYIKNKNIKIEEPVELTQSSSWGKLWQYVMHAGESNIFLKIIKYIRKHSDRINLIGTDNDMLDRDYDMYKIIMKNLNKAHINFFWAHNAHVDNRQYEKDNLKWIINKKHKWFCGHYLKEKLKDKYCIILSQAYQGENRFNSYCLGKDCITRIWQLKYFYKKFKHESNKKHVDKLKSFQLLDKFDSKLIEFSNSYFKKNDYGYHNLYDETTWNYILFWNKVTRLEPYYEY